LYPGAPAAAGGGDAKEGWLHSLFTFMVLRSRVEDKEFRVQGLGI
jgi:hypothetical protein